MLFSLVSSRFRHIAITDCKVLMTTRFGVLHWRKLNTQFFFSAKRLNTLNGVTWTHHTHMHARTRTAWWPQILFYSSS